MDRVAETDNIGINNSNVVWRLICGITNGTLFYDAYPA